MKLLKRDRDCKTDMGDGIFKLICVLNRPSASARQFAETAHKWSKQSNQYLR